MKRTALGALALFAALFGGMQLVPYRVHNPEIRQEPEWNSPTTRALAKRACFDCHSNEVQVPWYGKVAPVAWIVRDHVDEARRALNFSEMDRPQEEAHEAGEEVREGEMPPWYYVRLHPEAQLTDAEWRQLAAGLDATLGDDTGAHASGLHRHDDRHHEHDD